MGQSASNNLNIQNENHEMNPLNQEINENEITISQNTENTIDFESIEDVNGEIIYAPPKVVQSPIIKCLINIHPKSLQFEQNLNKSRLSFLFDCEENAEIQIFYSATDKGEKDELVFVPLKEGNFNSVIKVNKGYNIPIKQEWEDSIDFSTYKQDELKYDIVQKRYPLIIVAKTVGGDKEEFGGDYLMNDEKKESKNSNNNIQVSYFNLTRTEEITAHLLQQKIIYNSHSYIVQEIYGVDSTHGGECVVCMAEPRNVVVLPCRHMCLCILCADIYRIKTNKCPICRGPSRSFIKVNDDKGEEDEPETPSNINNNPFKQNTTYLDD